MNFLTKEIQRLLKPWLYKTGAFSNGEKGWWKGQLWESIVSNNVYTPEQYAPNWKLVTE